MNETTVLEPCPLPAGTIVTVYKTSPDSPVQFCRHHHTTMRSAEHCRRRIARAAYFARAVLVRTSMRLFRLEPAAKPANTQPKACRLEDAMARAWAKRSA